MEFFAWVKQCPEVMVMQEQNLEQMKEELARLKYWLETRWRRAPLRFSIRFVVTALICLYLAWQEVHWWPWFFLAWVMIALVGWVILWRLKRKYHKRLLELEMRLEELSK